MNRKKLLMCVFFVWLFCIFFQWIVKADVSNVNLTLCEDTEKEYMLDVGEEKELCFDLKNKWEEDYIITYWFTEAIIDPDGLYLCSGKPSSWTTFAKTLKNPELKDITLKWGETKQIKETQIVPVWMTGNIYWCLSYTIKGGWYHTEWQMFTVIIARTLPLKVFIGKAGDIINNIEMLPIKWGVFSTDNKIKALVDKENKLVLSFLVQNNGNIEQDITITGTIYNMLWFEKSFSVSRKIGAKSSWELMTNVWFLPSYKGFFTINYSVENTPSFQFDVSNVDKSIMKKWYIENKAKIYIFSRITLIIIVLIIVLFIKLFSKRKTVIIKEW